VYIQVKYNKYLLLLTHPCDAVPHTYRTVHRCRRFMW